MIEQNQIILPHEFIPSAVGHTALAVMTKAPRAGEVKTRLIPPLTAAQAAKLNVCFLTDIFAAIAQAQPAGHGIACYTPLGAEEIYRKILPPCFQLMAQRQGDIGNRLIGALEDLFSVGFTSICLINSDSPTVPASTYQTAVRILSEPTAPVLLGPSDDGGYYLIGMRTLHRNLFDEINWSTCHVLAQTLERAREIDLPVCLLPAGYDVDDAATLNRLCQDLLGPCPVETSIAPATRQLLQDWTNRSFI